MKAVLVIDMPECCDYCPVCRFFGMSGFTECTVMNDKVNRDGQTRPDWCPLKPFPETKEKLEDLEEQGLLLWLPVAEGSTVYVLDYAFECKLEYKCPLSFDKYKCEEDIRCEHECKVYHVREAKFNHMMLNVIGKTVFLTKEEAEQALEKMG